MRTFKPKNKGLTYEPLTLEKYVIFGERNKNKEVIFETESFRVKEKLTLQQLKTML